MRFVKSIANGLWVAGFLVAAVVGWAKFGPKLGPSTGSNDADSRPAGQDAKDSPTSLVYFEGSIDVAPLLTSSLNDATSTLVIEAWRTDNGLMKEIMGRLTAASPKFPFLYHVVLSEDATSQFLSKEDFGKVRILATYCPNESRSSCKDGSFPRLAGFTDMSPKAVTNFTAGNGADHSPRAFQTGSTFINKSVENANLEECVRSGLTISGQIVPTAAFSAAGAPTTHFALVATPSARIGLSAPFVGNERRAISHAMMETAAAQGIAISGFDLTVPQSAAYSIKMPQMSPLLQRSFFAVACSPGEDNLTCAARLFPLPNSVAMTQPDLRTTKLVPKNFIVPMCGKKSDLYLHAWTTDAPAASRETYLKANPPEVVEGITF